MHRTAVEDRADRLLRKLSRVLGQVSSRTSPETVHQLRTTVRRIETLLNTHSAQKQPGLGKLTKQLARLRRRAGRVRDLDVQLGALRSVRLENSGREKALVARHLIALRQRQARRFVRALQQLDSGLNKRMHRVARVFAAGSSEAAESRDYTAQALLRFRKLVLGQPALTEDNLHAFRMDCKRIRYLAEMSGDMPGTRSVVTELKRIQDSIGEWHDWLTLTELADELLPTENSPLLAALRAQRSVKFNEALRVTFEVKQRLLRKGTKPAQAPRRKLAA